MNFPWIFRHGRAGWYHIAAAIAANNAGRNAAIHAFCGSCLAAGISAVR
jgi:hypothetical protein